MLRRFDPLADIEDPATLCLSLARATPSLAQRVIRWQLRAGRHGLPWQANRDPYRVWLSEIMLQQTQVATVLGYYDRFVVRFPDVQALAAASLDDVLAAWSGLGYYSRARHLHRCAQQVVRELDGCFPRRADELARLPGIGRSTAAAVAAFCFGERAAILDGNVKRVLCRVLAFGGDPACAPARERLWKHADTLLPHEAVDVYTQGLMDLGATLCRRRRPLCPDCPLAEVCAAHRRGQADAYPIKSAARVRARREHALLWLCEGQRCWLVRRPAPGVWAGLFSLPEWPSAEALARVVDGWPGSGQVLPPIEHALTHFDWRLLPLRWRLPARLPAARRRVIEAALPVGAWVEMSTVPQLGLPAPIRKLLVS